jgi:hypothetical protein
MQRGHRDTVSNPGRSCNTTFHNESISLKKATLRIAKTWDGLALPPTEQCQLSLGLSDQRLLVELEAPFHDDPAPPGPAGALDGLWDFEVVELFLLGTGQHYLELEFSPHGHYLALSMAGPRQRAAKDHPLKYRSRVDGERWSGSAAIPIHLLPVGLHAHNAYSIHGVGTARRYLAAFPIGGRAPDFHRLEYFSEIDWIPD